MSDLEQTRSGVYILPERELIDPRQVGGRLRAYCPIHGGDHQRSLSIALDGDAAGVGQCHACGARVIVPEMKPDWSADARAALHAQPRITADTLLRAPRPRPQSAPAPAEWQRAEMETLCRLDERMRERLRTDSKPREYLAARGIPLEIAEAAGVGYIPAEARLTGRLAKWRDRLMFPLGSPAGLGYIGRSLHGWEPGMDENAHKALLEYEGMPRRWEKTYPAGWHGYDTLQGAQVAVLVEGAFDRLALQAAGLMHVPVVALGGTAGQPDWLPLALEGVVLALDYDRPESRAAAAQLRANLRWAGVRVQPCAPTTDDGRGKDWSERWRVAEWEGVWPVFEAADTLAVELSAPSQLGRRSAPLPAAVMPAPALAEAHEPTARERALADGVVSALMRVYGLELAEVCELEPVLASRTFDGELGGSSAREQQSL